MKIEILGMGCPKCKKLEQRVRKIVEELNLDSEISKVTDLKKIADYGILCTPALAIDGEIKYSGRLPEEKEIKSLLESYKKCESK